MDYKMIADYFATPLSTVTVQNNGFLIEEDGTYLSFIHTPSYILVVNGVQAGKLSRGVSRTYPAHYTEWELIDHFREDLENMETELQEKLEKICLTL